MSLEGEEGKEGNMKDGWEGGRGGDGGRLGDGGREEGERSDGGEG